jgi:hypothetical protein
MAATTQRNTRGGRRATQFAVTLSPITVYEDIREDFLSYFEGVETYCVSVEHSDGVSGVPHLHAYLKFYELVDCDYVRNNLSFWPGTINVAVYKSRKTFLKYITKEDEKPFFNCPVGELLFHYRALQWALRSPTFEFSSPFVVEHCNKYRYLQEFHSEIRRRCKGCRPNIKCPSLFWPSWGLEVLQQICEQFFHRCRKALFLYGESGVGKTFVVRDAFMRMGFTKCYMPVPGPFFFGDYGTCAYDHIIFEEFEFDKYAKCYSQIKQLLNRARFAVDRKNRLPEYVRAQVPIVFISNSEPYCDRAFHRRLATVRAFESLEDAEMVVVLKEEVEGGEKEIIVISSDDEEENVQNESSQEVIISKEDLQTASSSRKVLATRNV